MYVVNCAVVESACNLSDGIVQNKNAKDLSFFTLQKKPDKEGTIEY